MNIKELKQNIEINYAIYNENRDISRPFIDC